MTQPFDNDAALAALSTLAKTGVDAQIAERRKMAEQAAEAFGMIPIMSSADVDALPSQPASNIGPVSDPSQYAAMPLAPPAPPPPPSPPVEPPPPPPAGMSRASAPVTEAPPMESRAAPPSAPSAEADRIAGLVATMPRLEPKAPPKAAAPPSGGGGGGYAAPSAPRAGWVPAGRTIGFSPRERAEVEGLSGLALQHQVQGADLMMEAAAAKGAAEASYAGAKEAVEKDHAEALRANDDRRQRYIDEQLTKLDQMAQRVASGNISDYWSDKSDAQKIGSAIAVGLGAFGAALTGGRNTAADMLTAAMDRDLKRKVVEADAAKAGLYAAKNNFMENLATFGTRDAALAATRAQSLRVIEGQIRRQYLDTAQTPEIRAQYEALLGQIGERAAKNQATFTDLMRDHVTAQWRTPQPIGAGAGKMLPDFDAAHRVINVDPRTGIVRVAGSPESAERLRKTFEAADVQQRLLSRVRTILKEANGLDAADVKEANRLQQELTAIRGELASRTSHLLGEGVMRGPAEEKLMREAVGEIEGLNVVQEHLFRYAPNLVTQAYRVSRNAAMGNPLENAEIAAKLAQERSAEAVDALEKTSVVKGRRVPALNPKTHAVEMAVDYLAPGGEASVPTPGTGLTSQSEYRGELEQRGKP